jgi:hypothetical protein
MPTEVPPLDTDLISIVASVNEFLVNSLTPGQINAVEIVVRPHVAALKTENQRLRDDLDTACAYLDDITGADDLAVQERAIDAADGWSMERTRKAWEGISLSTSAGSLPLPTRSSPPNPLGSR